MLVPSPWPEPAHPRISKPFFFFWNSAGELDKREGGGGLLRRDNYIQESPVAVYIFIQIKKVRCL